MVRAVHMTTRKACRPIHFTSEKHGHKSKESCLLLTSERGFLFVCLFESVSLHEIMTKRKAQTKWLLETLQRYRVLVYGRLWNGQYFQYLLSSHTKTTEHTSKTRRKTTFILRSWSNTYPGLRVPQSHFYLFLKPSPPAFGEVNDPHDEIHKWLWTRD